MIRNYLLVAGRNLLKNKVFSLVNILGLAIGMSACFFLFLYVHFELSYDNFNSKADRLYRVTATFTGSFGDNVLATNHPGVASTLKNTFPEVEEVTRLAPLQMFMSGPVLSTSIPGRTFNEDHILFVDTPFFRMFSYPFVEGDPQTALMDNSAIVISEMTAKKYFGKENPLGKTLTLNGRVPLKVTGVFRDMPANSHLHFDAAIPFAVQGSGSLDFLDHTWTWPEFYTYVLLKPGADPARFEAKFPALIERNIGDKEKQFNYRNFFHLQPVRDIHLAAGYEKEMEAGGNRKELYFLSIIGIFILVIAWINYINLSTAKATERAREVGLRKVVGASKSQLIAQFFMDSLLINVLASTLAALIILSCYPYFSRLTGRDIGVGFSAGQPIFWAGLLGALVLGAFLVGAYPAFVLAAFRPVLVLKGRLFQSGKGIVMRKVLVSFQFVLSILLIAGTFTIFQQLSYMRKQALGYTKDQILVIKSPGVLDSTFGSRIRSFKNLLSSDAAVEDISTTGYVPGNTITESNSVRKIDEDIKHNFSPFLVGVDDRFVSTYQIKVVAGRNFLPGDSSNISSKQEARVMVNEVLAKILGFQTPQAAVGQQILFHYGMDSIQSEIVGVLQNYHQKSLKEAYEPILYYYPSYPGWSYVSVRINTRDLREEMAFFEKAYKNVFPGNAFDYFFLNDYFNHQYQADQQFGQVFGLFAILAVVVACLGLLGLSSFLIHLRTKEIGIRKVLGASVSSLLILFSRDFVRLLGLASAIALPLIYLTASRWLENYAFHISLGWAIFVLPPLLLLVISLLTISIHSIKAAMSNPIDSIKTE
jgi:putative ABC transport system permease protein